MRNQANGEQRECGAKYCFVARTAGIMLSLLCKVAKICRLSEQGDAEETTSEGFQVTRKPGLKKGKAHGQQENFEADIHA